MGRRRDLDGVRAVAIIGVLGVHGGQIPGGDFGVVVFFVLSGYLITTLLLRERDDTGRIDGRFFYLRRAARLLPALFLALVGYVALAPRLGDSVGSALGNAAVALFYGMDIKIAYFAHQSNPVSWAWSLSIEEQFYLVWPLVLGVALWRKRVGVATAIAAAGVIVPTVMRDVTVPHTASLLSPDGVSWLFRNYFAVDSRMDGLFAGCLLALAVWHRPTLVRRVPAVVLGAAGLTGIGLAYGLSQVFDRATYTIWMPVVDLATVALLYGLLGAPRWLVPRLLALPPLAYLGRISYGVYVWNSTLGLLAGTLVSRHHTTERGAIWLAMVFFIAIVSYHLVEQPILRRVTRKPPPAPTSAVSVPPQRTVEALPLVS